MSAPRTSAPQFGEDPQELQKKVVGFLYQMRIDAKVKCVVLSEGAAALKPRGAEEGKMAWQLSSAIVSNPIGGLLSTPVVTRDATYEPATISDRLNAGTEWVQPRPRAPSPKCGLSRGGNSMGSLPGPPPRPPLAPVSAPAPRAGRRPAHRRPPPRPPGRRSPRALATAPWLGRRCPYRSELPHPRDGGCGWVGCRCR